MENPLSAGVLNDVLSDEQIYELLRNAEHRRRGQVVASSPQNAVQSINRNTTLGTGKIAQPYVVTKNGIAHADTPRLLSDKDRQLAGKVRRVEDPAKVREKATKEKKATAGSDWFNLPKTKLTPELKRDLQLLKMRNVLDPKRHYKKESGKLRPPEFSQVGTIIEGPTEFYSSRLPRRDRKKTFVEEVLAAEESTGRFKSKYNDIQASKVSGKKAYYKKLMEKRSKGKQKR